MRIQKSEVRIQRRSGILPLVCEEQFAHAKTQSREEIKMKQLAPSAIPSPISHILSSNSNFRLSTCPLSLDPLGVGQRAPLPKVGHSRTQPTFGNGAHCPTKDESKLLPPSAIPSPISNIQSPKSYLSPISYLRYPKFAAFSMIEVSVAIAVMAFGIVAILGLFSISMGGSKDSVTDSVVSLKAMDILARAESGSFTGVLFDDGMTTNLDLSATSNLVSVYYDNTGLVLSNAPGALSTSLASSLRAAYGTEIRTFATADSNGDWNPAIDNSITNSLAPSTNTAILQLRIIYPPAAPPAQQKTNYFQTVIVNREVL